MNKKEPKKNIFNFFLFMLFVFMIIEVILHFFPNLFINTINSYKYGTDIIFQLFYAILALIIMLLFKNSYVFTNKQTKFKKSLMYGLPILIYSSIMLIVNLFKIEEYSLGNLLNSFIYCIILGISQEFLYRGWIQNEFIERFSDTKENVIKSIALTSLIYGFMNLTSFIGESSNIIDILSDVINITFFGFLLGVIYYKTKNIWSVIFIHSFYEFSNIIYDSTLVRSCSHTYDNISIIIRVSILILVVTYWLLNSIYVINKTTYPDDRQKNSKKLNNILVVSMIFAGLLALLPYNNIISTYSNSETCYHYNTLKNTLNNIKHYPETDNYSLINSFVEINEDSEEVFKSYYFDFYVEDNKFKIRNNKTNYIKELNYNVKDYSNIEIIENDDYYEIIIIENSIETTMYYSGKLLMSELSNDDDYLDKIEKSFTKIELPYISTLGYLTYQESSIKYPLFKSKNNDTFIILNDELFILK